MYEEQAISARQIHLSMKEEHADVQLADGSVMQWQDCPNNPFASIFQHFTRQLQLLFHAHVSDRCQT